MIVESSRSRRRLLAALLCTSLVCSLNAGKAECGTADYVRNMRGLKNKIGYYAADGTNCMRSIGLAAVGTPFAGQYNVDQAVKTARKLKILKEAGRYSPLPGDIAVVEDGSHAVMLTEYGGTIQNGRSHGGIWESVKSPKEMFGKVDYYIALSELPYSGSRAEKQPVFFQNGREGIAFLKQGVLGFKKKF